MISNDLTEGSSERDTLPSANPASVNVETTGLLDNGSKQTPLPKLRVSVLLFIFLPESITSTLIYPFIVQLVRDLNIVKGNPAAVGYYSGLIESCFFVTEAICVFFWSRMSDKIGRKPVILFGSLSLTAALLSFGFSKTLWGLMASRALQGALNGNIGVARAMLTEVDEPKSIILPPDLFQLTRQPTKPIEHWPSHFHQWSRLKRGHHSPFIGGFLANPAERFPGFSNNFWKAHRYLLPCLTAALFPITAFFLTVFFIRETRKSILQSSFLSKAFKVFYGATETRTASIAPVQPWQMLASSDPTKLSLLYNKRLVFVLINHAFLALLDQSYIALLAVFFATPIASGGLGLTPSQIGFILAGLGLFHGIIQPFCFERLYKRVDPKRLYTICMFMVVPAYACFPLLNNLARVHGLKSAIPLLVIQALLLLPTYTAFSAMFIFISYASPTKELLGTTNGIAQTVFSSMGAIGPAGVTALFAISQEKRLLNGYLVYLVMCTIGFFSGLSAYYLLPDKPGENVTHTD